MASLVPFPLPFPLSSELLYGFLMKQLNVMLTTYFQRVCTPYLTVYPVPSSKPAPPPAEPDEERELDLLQMDRLLKWMELVFDPTFLPNRTPSVVPEETHRAYKQELFNIYRTLCSDYQQYRNWRQYNQGLWLFSSYRRRDTKALARKLLSDVRLFKEGLQIFFLMEHKSPSRSPEKDVSSSHGGTVPSLVL
jgi:hypothetical protein